MMRSFLSRIAIGLLVLTATATAQPTAFTYQGQLTDQGTLANGSYELRFLLYPAAATGAPVGPILTNSAVAVVNGLFTTTLDFGEAAFDGAERWLEIGVRPQGGSVFVAMTPRQLLAPTPYALRARSMADGAITDKMLADGTITAAKLHPGTLSRLETPDGSQPNAVNISAEGWMGVGTASPVAGLSVTGGRPIIEPQVLFQVQDENTPWTGLGGATGVAVLGNLLAVAGAGDGAVSLVDLANPEAPVLRSTLRDSASGYTNLAGATGVALRGGLLAIAAEVDHAVTLVTVTNPAQPVLRSSLRNGTGAWTNLAGARSVAFSSGGVLAVAASQGHAVTIITPIDPNAPFRTAVFRDGEAGFDYLAGAADVAWSGNLLAIAAAGDHAVTLVTVSIVSPPQIQAVLRDGMGGFDDLRGATAVAFSGNLLAIAAEADNAVSLVDVTNPANPVLRAVLRSDSNGIPEMLGPCDLAFSGNWLAVASRWSDRILAVDVSDPSQPECRGMASDGAGGAAFLRTPRGVTFAGATLAATGSGDSGLALFAFAARGAGFTTDGWVGIGTALPQAPLHVVGGLRVEGDRASLHVDRVEAGYDAHALAVDSLALGRSAVASGAQSTSIGYGNVASGHPATAMGVLSVASGNNAVAIGNQNIASGESATALGALSTASGLGAITLGDSAQADGTGAIALGFRAQASHNGSFVWADRTAHTTAASTEANQFTARASGGVRFFSNSTQTTGSRLAPGGNSWSSVSDRAVKENLSPIDPRAILERVAALPITEWNLVSQEPSIRHLGPMAQDFHAAFGLGEDDRHISSSDADGVALAAIQGLYQLLRERDARIAELEARLATLEQTRNQP